MNNGHAAQNGVNGAFLGGNQMNNAVGSVSNAQQIQMGQQAINAMPVPQGYAPVEQYQGYQQYPQTQPEMQPVVQGYETPQQMVQPAQNVQPMAANQWQIQEPQMVQQPNQQPVKQDVVQTMKRGVKIMNTISSESVANMDSLCARLGNDLDPHDFYENADEIVDSTVDSNFGVKVGK